MKSFWTVVVVMFSLSACNDTATVQVHINDSVEKKLDDKAEKLWDSTKKDLKQTGDELKEKAKGLKGKVEIKIGDEAKKDSVKGKKTDK